MFFNTTCNTTLEEMRIRPGDEIPIAGSLTFHELALIIAAASTLVAVVMSLWLIWMHATHYTKPQEQRHIIRILFMVPVYAASSLLSLRFTWHAIYFQVISDCYEAFAISSFFALLSYYVAPDLHEQKNYFRAMSPVKPWIWPLNWFSACCGGARGPWRTPSSGLTWFNIIWIGVYQYCFIRVGATISAVVTQHFRRYCESSNSPVFAHIWIVAIVCVAVTIAMYCLIQFYVQLREPLAEHRPFLKICAIKLVVFLSFWQSVAISVATSQLDVIKPNDVFAYPDLKVGIPSLLLCFEMALFAIMHLWAFPYQPYRVGAKQTFYPVPDPSSGAAPKENKHSAPAGGFLGLLAIWDALNLWDVVKAFGRGIRWLFVGVKHRHGDGAYNVAAARKGSNASSDDLDLGNLGVPRRPGLGGGNSTEHLPIANQFRRSRFMMLGAGGVSGVGGGQGRDLMSSPLASGASADISTANVNTQALHAPLSPQPPSPGFHRPASAHEGSGLIAHAASPGGHRYEPPSPYRDDFEDEGPSRSGGAVPYPGDSSVARAPPRPPQHQTERPYRPQQNFSRNGAQAAVGQALWGPQQPRQQRQQPYDQAISGDPRHDGMI